MSKKKKITFADVLWKIIVKPAWYWLVTIIPTAIAMYQFFGGDRNTIANISSRIWLVVAIIAFLLTIVISTFIFRNSRLLLHDKTKRSGRSRNKKALSAKSDAKDGGQSVAISGNNYAPINQGSNIAPQYDHETQPNIEVTKFGSEVLTLKLINKIAGQAIQIGVGETLERFYIEFVNRKKTGVKTEDAIKVYVNISFLHSRL
ncbi:MAG TPA: hypothetical protein VFQ23_07695 [Anaerolineales bacterium]|nr:hypothetical protein [Anaerolineales bacterium]